MRWAVGDSDATILADNAITTTRPPSRNNFPVIRQVTALHTASGKTTTKQTLTELDKDRLF